MTHRFRTMCRPRIAPLATALGACALAASLPAQAVEVVFEEREVTASAALATDLHVGDMDGDGDLDLVSASSNDDRLAWYDNDGLTPAGFTQRTINAFTDGARVALPADIDGDGDLDVVAASLFDTDLSWWSNLGGSPPSFVERVIDESVLGAADAAVADLDRDGDADIVLASSDSNAVFWFESDGEPNPGFTGRLAAAGISGARSVATADVNGDGRTDIVVASEGDGAVRALLNDGGTPAQFLTVVVSTELAGTNAIAVADVDADGDLDILASSPDAGTMVWLESDGGPNPSFFARTFPGFPGQIASVDTADVDLDGDLDVLVAARDADTVSWYENSGDPNPLFLLRPVVDTADFAAHVVAGDLDGDGDPDIAYSAGLEDAIRWSENLTLHRSAVLPEAIPLAESAFAPGALAIADLDRDGDDDVLVAGGDGLSWYAHDGADAPGFVPQPIVGTAGGPFAVAIVDVDGDGALDLAVASSDDATVAWYASDGGLPPAFTETVVASDVDGASGIAAADFDADGDLDLAAVGSLDGELVWYASDGASPPAFGAVSIATDATDAAALAATDLNTDGAPDLVATARGADAVRYYLNSSFAPGSFTSEEVATGVGAPSALAVGDLDGDGDTDLLVALEGESRLVWYDNDGALLPAFTEHEIDAEAAPSGLAMLDLDADGDTDVLASFADDGRTAWYANDGASPPSFELRESAAVVGASALATADLDRDGRPDAVVAGSTDDRVVWLANRGGQIALPTSDLTTGGLDFGATVPLLRIDLEHRGRSGDLDAELTRIDLLFEESPGVPLDAAGANTLLEVLTLWHDDGDGEFGSETDTLVATFEDLDLEPDGGLPIELQEDDPGVRVAFGESSGYFVVTTVTADLDGPPSQFRLTHRVDDGSQGREADNLLPLRLESPGDVSTPVLAIGIPADLELTLETGTDPVPVGDPIVYTIEVTNLGPNPATDVTLVDVLPAEVEFDEAETSVGSCSVDGGTVTCALGTLQVDETAQVTLSVTTVSGGLAENTATVSSTEFDPDPANNGATVTTTIDADLELTLEGSCLAACPGADIVYRVTGDNTRSTASRLTVRATSPLILTILDITVPPGPFEVVEGARFPPTSPPICPINLVFEAQLLSDSGDPVTDTFTVQAVRLN